MHYAWFIWSLIILAVWTILFLWQKGLRKEMLVMSLVTLPLGLTEPLFVPEYWNPPSLFDLAQKTGFDIESLIFTFSIGGIGSILYNSIFKKKMVPLSPNERFHRRHALHLWALLSPILVFPVLAILTPLNHIYCGIIAMFVGAISALLCRPTLKKKIWVGGLLFLFLYFLYFLILIRIFPGYVEQVWNLAALSGVMFLGIPLEEYLFAFSFGLYWSSLYEHLFWLKPV